MKNIIALFLASLCGMHCFVNEAHATRSQISEATKTPSQCRIEWKYLRQETQEHGDWFDLSQKSMLQGWVDGMNKKHQGEIVHWLACK